MHRCTQHQCVVTADYAIHQNEQPELHTDSWIPSFRQSPHEAKPHAQTGFLFAFCKRLTDV